jgi:quinolinate synthase
MSLRDEVIQLKKERDAVILAHYYQDGEIQDVADFVGDSFYLAKMGQQVPQKTILLAGVVFMAESVKILNPEKVVLVPDLNAGCSLVNEAPFEAYSSWKKKYPRGITVTYINSSAEVKTISDVIVTSSNAKKIIESIPADRPILFGPDVNLGKYLEKETGRSMILWPGSCQVHVLFEAEKLVSLMKMHPDAVVIAHPECDDSVLMWAKVIGSTSRLLEEVQNNPAKKFIVATETGIFHQMKKVRPDAELIQAPVNDPSCSCNDCPYMKLSSLEKIKATLKGTHNQVSVSREIQSQAKIGLERMMDIAAGKPVTWPS